jgi:murein L,D-transpeptidase YafK
LSVMMGCIRRNMFFSVRLLGALLLLSCLSPAPDAPAGKPPTFATFVSDLPGQLRIVIWKSQYTLTLYKGDYPVKTYRAVFGKGYQDGDKQRTGDKRTPEGEFFICTMNHSKRFYKFMGLSYPGPDHAENGLRSGMISPEQYEAIRKANEERQQPPWDTALGGAVGIHGRMLGPAVDSSQLTAKNWTDGCIALENADVNEIFSVVSLGTPVTILP